MCVLRGGDFFWLFLSWIEFCDCFWAGRDFVAFFAFLGSFYFFFSLFKKGKPRLLHYWGKLFFFRNNEKFSLFFLRYQKNCVAVNFQRNIPCWGRLNRIFFVVYYFGGMLLWDSIVFFAISRNFDLFFESNKKQRFLQYREISGCFEFSD
jgi:hypothetical protein